MADSPFVFEVTEENYHQIVLENSTRVPVLVDFWADWCGPCKMQLPVLLKLVSEYQGKFLLAKIDTDAQRGLASQHGIRSIPTMKLFVGGQAVEEILGAQTESTLRMLLDKYVARESDSLREQALQQAATGDIEGALTLLRETAAKDPDNPRAQLDYLQLTMEAGLEDEAQQALQAMPRDLRESPDIRRLTALLGLIQRGAEAPEDDSLTQRIAQNPDDLEARDLLAARLAAKGDAQGALDQYLEILRRNREYGEEAGRKGMLAVFELLGNQGPLVSRYRSLMFTAMH